jgi:hypothetical protein
MRLSFRALTRPVAILPLPVPAPADTQYTPDAHQDATHPALAQAAPDASAKVRPDADADADVAGPVMVESGMDEALRAVSARDHAPTRTPAAAAGNAQDPFAINPDAYLPADALDKPPQLAGPWQLNEAAVPPRQPGSPTTLTIAMRLWVSADGHIDAVQVLSAEPEVPWLESLLQDITQTPLRPATEQGRAVASSWLVEWQLDLSGGM